MRHFALKLALVSSLYLHAHSAAAQPAETNLVQPGAWNVVPQTTAGASISYQLCFKTGSLEDVRLLLPNMNAGADCPNPQIDVRPGALSWRLECPRSGLTAQAEYALGPERIEGTVTITPGSGRASTRQTITAHRAGACPS